MKFTLLLSLTLLSLNTFAQTIPPAEDQIAATVQAAPEEMRAGAAVLGYNAEGKLVELRKGTNELVCLADDPKDAARFSAACYHKDLDPFMARGRELTAQGITGGNRNAEYRWKEVKEGKLKCRANRACRMCCQAKATTRPAARWLMAKCAGDLRAVRNGGIHRTLDQIQTRRTVVNGPGYGRRAHYDHAARAACEAVTGP